MLKQLKKEVEDLKVTLEHKKTESEELLREVGHLKAALEEKTKETQEMKEELEEMKNEMNELNTLVEEKSREADESMDKCCTLMVQVHKLEETNEALATRLGQLSADQHRGRDGSNQRRRSHRRSALKNQQENLEECENVPPTATPPRKPQGPSPAKRGHRDISDKDSAQEALHNLTKKIKASSMTTPKTRSQQQEEEEEEFRPEGLPELVQRGTASRGGGANIKQLKLYARQCIAVTSLPVPPGFADIPLGEASPFIVRRTMVQRCSPRLAARQAASAADSKVSRNPE